jgi:hypothetical protein
MGNKSQMNIRYGVYKPREINGIACKLNHGNMDHRECSIFKP